MGEKIKMTQCDEHDECVRVEHISQKPEPAPTVDEDLRSEFRAFVSRASQGTEEFVAATDKRNREFAEAVEAVDKAGQNRAKKQDEKLVDLEEKIEKLKESKTDAKEKAAAAARSQAIKDIAKTSDATRKQVSEVADALVKLGERLDREELARKAGDRKAEEEG